MKKINLGNKLSKFNEYWSPKIIEDLNDSYVKLAKFKGEFIWHKHDDEDELFLVIKGKLIIKLKNHEDIIVSPGELVIVPKGIEHLPIAEEEVQVMIIEPKKTLNTGDGIKSDFTKKELERI